jgi:hypothetical protein
VELFSKSDLFFQFEGFCSFQQYEEMRQRLGLNLSMEKFLEKISDFFTAKNESSFELLSEKTGQFSLIDKSPIKDNKLLELNLH